jgi:predicted transposase/invertase (TIGR01784 family)
LETFEEAKRMQYVTTGERRAKQEGRVEERFATQKTIALNLLNKNMNLETIAEVTGLTIEQLQALQTEAQHN